ncbi:MAG: hypothetical protein OER04_13560, partial [Cyclobacteriaceae bacterium]|nr:hypothetical protein [Cyclobacteriaceae bacterium]
VIKMHDRSHGLIPHQIIEMNSKAVMSFLGRIEDPEVTDLTDIHTFLRSRLVDTMGSEIQYVIRDHGPEIPGRLEEQLNSYTGGCDVYHCSDVQFAVHKP